MANCSMRARSDVAGPINYQPSAATRTIIPCASKERAQITVIRTESDARLQPSLCPLHRRWAGRPRAASRTARVWICVVLQPEIFGTQAAKCPKHPPEKSNFVLQPHPLSLGAGETGPSFHRRPITRNVSFRVRFFHRWLGLFAHRRSSPPEPRSVSNEVASPVHPRPGCLADEIRPVSM